MKHLLYIGPTVLALLVADRLVTQDGTAGWERNSVYDMKRRWEARRAADGVVLLGSSTSADWLSSSYLERRLDAARGTAVDAHVNGCHQGCSFAQVRWLIRQGRRFKVALYGTNQFQLCEFAHSKRVLQQRMLIPAVDAWRLLPHYLRAEEPLTYVGRFLGGSLSSAYADTSVLQQRWGNAVFYGGHADRRRRARVHGHRWHRPRPPAPRWAGHCGYQPEQIALKLSLSRALLDDLGQLAERTLLLLLPDENLERLDDDPELARAWAAHRQLHQRLATERTHVELIDLSRGGAQTRDHFRDGMHVNQWGARLQRARFEQLLAELPGGEAGAGR